MGKWAQILTSGWPIEALASFYLTYRAIGYSWCYFSLLFYETWIAPLSLKEEKSDGMRTCVYAECALSIGLSERVWVWGESVSLGARRGLGCLLPADFLIAMEILNLCLSSVCRCSQGTHKHSFSHTNTHTHRERERTGCRKLSST